MLPWGILFLKQNTTSLSSSPTEPEDINALDRDHPDLQLKRSRYVADEEFSAIQVKIREIVEIVKIFTKP
jgi:hypothetical protein